MMPTLNVSDWNVLLVDDEPDNLSVLELLLTFHDAHVTSVRSGQEALQLLGEQPFTLALVDIQMPKVSGWDIIKYIRASANPAVRTMLAIAVTANAMAGDREQVLDAGFDGYVAKPIDVAPFMQTLRETVEARSAQNAQPAEPLQDTQKPATAKDLPQPNPALAVQDHLLAGENNDRQDHGTGRR